MNDFGGGRLEDWMIEDLVVEVEKTYLGLVWIQYIKQCVGLLIGEGNNNKMRVLVGRLPFE